MLSNTSTYCKYYVFVSSYSSRSKMTTDTERLSPSNNRHPKKKRSFYCKAFSMGTGGVGWIHGGSGMAVGGLYLYLGRDLPKISSLSEYRPPTITEVFSDDNRKIGEFYSERRIVIPLSEMSQTLKGSVYCG